MHETFEELVLLDFDWNFYEGVHLLDAAFLEIRPLEVGFKGELVLESVGFVRVGSDLSGFVIEDEEETGVDIVFVEVNAFEFVPEVSLIADEIPSEFLLIKVKVDKVLIVSSFDGFEVLFGLHFLFLWEGEDVGYFCFIIVKGTIQLSTGVLIFKLVSVAEDLYVDNGADVNLFKLEVESHWVN